MSQKFFLGFNDWFLDIKVALFFFFAYSRFSDLVIYLTSNLAHHSHSKTTYICLVDVFTGIETARSF